MNEDTAQQVLKKLLECQKNLEDAISKASDSSDTEELNKFTKVALKEGPSGAISYICYLYPLLDPYCGDRPPNSKFSFEGFDFNDPWHRNAYLNFMFRCCNCNAKVVKDEAIKGDIKSNPLELSVSLSNRAKELGWSYNGKFSFFCGGCSNST